MATVFQQENAPVAGAVFDTTKGLIANSNVPATMLQNVQLSEQQQVNRVYEIGEADKPRKIYYVGGPSQGSVGIGHVLGPAVALSAFFAKYGKLCSAGENFVTLKLAPGTCGTGAGASGVSVKALNCTLNQIGLSTQASDNLVNTSAQLMYTGTEWVDGASPAAGG